MIGLDIMHHIYNKYNKKMALKLRWLRWLIELIGATWKICLELLAQIIMKCVSTTSIVVRYNNTRTSYFKPSRGLRQRDPLSPLLFVISMEGLSVIINYAKKKKWRILYSHRNFKMLPSHLAFADDFILFSKAIRKASRGLKRLYPFFAKFLDKILTWANQNFSWATLYQLSFSNLFAWNWE